MVLAASLILAAFLAAIVWFDARSFRIPDWLSLPLIALGLGAAWLFRPEMIAWHLAGAAAGYLLIRGLGVLYLRMRGTDGIGLGDAKLLAAAGAWLGLAALPLVLLIASLAGLIAVYVLRWLGRADARAPVPFGPFIALGIWVVWRFGSLSAPPVWS